MKTVKNKGGLNIAEPETALEAVEQLEEFLIADFGQKDWSRKFLKRHFAICKRDIKKIDEGKRKKARDTVRELQDMLTWNKKFVKRRSLDIKKWEAQRK